MGAFDPVIAAIYVNVRAVATPTATTTTTTTTPLARMHTWLYKRCA